MEMGKSLKLIIAFATTTQAMKTEHLCNEKKMEGRLIPIPREISAGCGFVWCTAPDNKEDIIRLLGEANIVPEGIYEMFL